MGLKIRSCSLRYGFFLSKLFEINWWDEKLTLSASNQVVAACLSVFTKLDSLL